MKIHGVRIYTNYQTVLAVDAPMYIHDSLCRECPDFYFLFHPMAEKWRGLLIADSFPVNSNRQGGKEDPTPRLRERFGASLVAADLNTQFMLLHGDNFPQWAPTMAYCEGAFLPIFEEAPGFEVLYEIYQNLTTETWPARMKALVHMWDDVYWQFFSPDSADMEFLIQAHAKKNPKLEMYFVDFDREYPDPSNEELKPVC
jgi:hypothetical protein